MISRGSAVFRLPIGFAPGRSNNAPWSAPSGPSLSFSLVFLLKRRERSRVAAERIGGGYSLAFFLLTRDFGLAHEIPDIFLPLLLAHRPFHVLLRDQQNIREHIRIHPLSGRRKPFPRFYILDEIPAALCPFITFANQMMSLDILRLGFIVIFYAGRTASVKRFRAVRSRLIGYHAEIRSLSRSRFLDRRPYGFFLLFLTTTWEPAILFYCLYIAGYFLAAFHVRLCPVSFYDKPLCVTCISNATKPVQGIYGEPWSLEHEKLWLSDLLQSWWIQLR